MSLSVARYAATSAMMATQTRIGVASANIANADTDGYTKKTANQTATVSNGVGTGAAVTGITSNVDTLLLKSLVAAVSSLGAAQTADDYASRLQALFGTTDGSSDASGTSIANTLSSLATALSDLADTPESATLKTQVVNALDDVAGQLRDTSAQIQELRGNADHEVASDVDSANNLLSTIKDLNTQITNAASGGNETADLEDQRNSALQSLASLMDINYYTSSSGAVQVYTTSGQVLLDSSVHKLSFIAAAAVTAASSYSASSSSSGLSGISVDGADITSQIKSGSLAALVAQRDTTLPAAQADLDQLAVQLADAFNNIGNAGTASPPPNSLTGTAAVSSSDPFSASGTVRIAITDSDGKLVSYQDVDLSGYSTVGDLVSGLDSISGVSASIDATGHVAIAAEDASDGIAVNEMTSAVGSSGEGLSAWLGLNDLVTATGASDFQVRNSLLADSSLLPSSTLDASSTLTTGAQVVSEGSDTVVQNLYDALTGDTSFAAAGNLSSRKTPFSSYAADIVSDAATASTRTSNTLTTKQTVKDNLASTISSESGVNIDEETAQLSQLQNEYAAAAQVLQILNEMFDSLLTSVQSS